MKLFMLALVSILSMGCSAEDENNPSPTVVATGNVVFDSSVSPVTTSNQYKPTANTTWQWQLQGNLNTSYNVDLYDVDLFDTSAITIAALQSQGKKVICYFSAGSYEDFRDDSSSFPLNTLGNSLDGFEDEKWLDISNESIGSIMQERLNLAVTKGCDGVEPDNMDGYLVDNNAGFALSADDQLAYNKFIANEARTRGLSVGLKNDVDQIIELEPYYDFAVNEQCHQYNECENMQAFITANKPVFSAEYDAKYKNDTNEARTRMCQDAISLNFQTLVLPLDLDDSFRFSCN